MKEILNETIKAHGNPDHLVTERGRRELVGTGSQPQTRHQRHACRQIEEQVQRHEGQRAETTSRSAEHRNRFLLARWSCG